MTSPALEALDGGFFIRDAETVARDLLGRYLVRSAEAECLAIGRIVEVEAYLGAIDPASHAAGGRRTARTETMYRRGGVAYVYLIYGMHHCLNVVAGPAEEAQAVLVRAIEPVTGGDWMWRNRGLDGVARPGQIGGGPGKLCQALDIDRSFDGCSLREGDLVVAAGSPPVPGEVARGPRIGVDYAGEAALWPLRFAVRGHLEMSLPRLG